MFAFNIERNRFFELSLRRAKSMPTKQTDDRSKRGRSKADEAELLRNLAALKASGTLSNAENMQMDLSDEEEKPPPPKPTLSSFPHRRFNSHLAVQSDTLFILGGSYEHRDKEFTFDDMHTVDLARLDGVREIFRRDPSGWGEEDQSQSEGSDESELSDEEMITEDSGGVLLPIEDESVLEAAEHTEAPKLEETDEEPMDMEDNRPYPRPFESLRGFYGRTSLEWQKFVMDSIRYGGDGISYTPKELRRVSFEAAESRWWDCREELMAEEDRQEEAGIGEVVNLADRVQEGPGRRRG